MYVAPDPLVGDRQAVQALGVIRGFADRPVDSNAWLMTRLWLRQYRHRIAVLVTAFRFSTSVPSESVVEGLGWTSLE